jgi:diguanylate cyclase (GGDEF)-like protein
MGKMAAEKKKKQSRKKLDKKNLKKIKKHKKKQKIRKKKREVKTQNKKSKKKEKKHRKSGKDQLGTSEKQLTDEELKPKKELLSQINMFSSLTRTELEVIARYSRFLSFASGEVIFEEGSVADEVYIVTSGQVMISKTTEDGGSLDIAQFVEGESFGELDLLDDLPRTATARSVDSSRVLVFPGKEYDFQEILPLHPDLFARILHKLLIMIAGRLRSVNTLVSERTPWLQDLRMQLYRDKLTGMFNRAFLEEEYSRQLSEYGNDSCLMFVKPDNFKTINDKYGHEAGDRALVFLAEKVSSIIRDTDIPVRYRGNEMAIILPDTIMESAFTIAETLRAEIAETNISGITNGEDFFITMSVGISSCPHDHDRAEDLIKATYEKLFSARDGGGNRIVCRLEE